MRSHLDVVAKDLAVALGAALAQSLTSLAASRHVVSCVFGVLNSDCRVCEPGEFMQIKWHILRNCVTASLVI